VFANGVNAYSNLFTDNKKERCIQQMLKKQKILLDQTISA